MKYLLAIALLMEYFTGTNLKLKKKTAESGDKSWNVVPHHFQTLKYTAPQ
jgi:hypothetical protein